MTRFRIELLIGALVALGMVGAALLGAADPVQIAALGGGTFIALLPASARRRESCARGAH